MAVTPTCHPEKKHGAKGLCRVCYNRQLRIDNPQYRENCVKSSVIARNKPAGRRALHNNTLLARYGITLEQKEKMFRDQNGACKLCGEKNKKLIVEHCHVYGKVRGLTCNRCNAFVSHLEKYPGIVERAMEHIKP